ncbi:MAG: hypothetical protein IJZ42_08460 [Lachnospiraceae bacterium]|nr:hypothetical protein [Lachnospiraceae bacterium]MBQ8878365.1 hypothetical protein [Lachnospiraceae bacterium]
MKEKIQKCLTIFNTYDKFIEVVKATMPKTVGVAKRRKEITPTEDE